MCPHAGGRPFPISAGQTQQQVADEIGWSRAQVSQYASLDAIDKGAWEVIATAVTKNLMQRQNGDVADNATPVAFSENLLRSIIPLKAEQQGTKNEIERR